ETPPGLTLTAMGNKLIASSDDPQVLALVQDLARLLTQTGSDGDFEILRLRWSDPAGIAKVLDEMFNTPSTKGARRVRIIAEPATNSVLVKASPMDLAIIHAVVKHIDAAEQDSKVEIKTWIMGPLKNAAANDLAKVVREVYRGEAGRPNQPGFTVTADP